MAKLKCFFWLVISTAVTFGQFKPFRSKRFQNSRMGVVNSVSDWPTGTCDAWRSFLHRRTFESRKSYIQSKMTDKYLMDPEVYKLSSGYPCNRFDTFLTQRAHTDQRLAQSDVFTFGTPWNRNLRLGPTARPAYLIWTQRVTIQADHEVRIHNKMYTCLSYS